MITWNSKSRKCIKDHLLGVIEEGGLETGGCEDMIEVEVASEETVTVAAS